MHRIPHLAYHTMFMCWLFTMLCASFRCLLLRVGSDNVAFVRIHSSTSVCLLHELVLLPCRISGKMTATLDLTTIIALLVASFYRYAALPIICSSSLPNCHEPLTFVTFPSKLLFGYVTALLSPSYSIVSYR